MKTLPLFYYPTTWVWVDDDQTLLTAMTRVFNKTNAVLPFYSASECLAYFKQYQSPLIRHGFLRNDPGGEHYRLLQSVPLNFDSRTIVNLLQDSKRHEEITAMVIDYNMPGINGVELARLTQPWLIQKILLTGTAYREDQVTSGFNHQLISRFVQKSEPEMLNKLTTYLHKLSYGYFQAITSLFVSYLEVDEKLALSDPTFIDFFELYCQSHDIKEYYLIEKQGSFLCIDSQGARSCLVVHTQRSIDAWLSINGNENSLSEDELSAVKGYKKIPFFGIHHSASQIDLQQKQVCLYEPHTLKGRQTYFWIVTKNF